MALSPPTERMLRAALALQVAVLEWDQAMAPNAHQTNALTPRSTITALIKAADEVSSSLMHIIRITPDTQG